MISSSTELVDAPCRAVEQLGQVAVLVFWLTTLETDIMTRSARATAAQEHSARSARTGMRAPTMDQATSRTTMSRSLPRRARTHFSRTRRTSPTSATPRSAAIPPASSEGQVSQESREAVASS